MHRETNGPMLGVIGLGLMFIVGYLVLGSYAAPQAGATYCLANADCVPAQCCHPTDAVNRQNAPDCSETACTLVCQPNTLDCGGGEIRCVDNRCTAVINSVEKQVIP